MKGFLRFYGITSPGIYDQGAIKEKLARLRGTPRSLVARLPWAQTPRLQQLRPFLLTTNVSNKSGNLLFALS